MSFGTQGDRVEEKLRLILSQISALRARLNSLALQYGVFVGLASILGAAAIIVASAFYLGPITFLALALILTIAAIATATGSARRAIQAWSSDETAAAIADRRAELKGRLATMVGVTKGGTRTALWPYLLEDTLSQRDQFAVSRIEPHRISKPAYAFLATAALAAVVFYLAFQNREQRLAARGASAAEAQIDIGGLDIRPADPGDGQEANIDADPATLDRLARKLAERRDAGRYGPASHLMADARDVASALQNRITGGKPHRPPLTLKLTDKGDDAPQQRSGSGPPSHGGASGQGDSKSIAGGNSTSGSADAKAAAPLGAAPGSGAPDKNGLAGLNGLGSPAAPNAPGNEAGAGPNAPPDVADNDAGAGGGSMHGAGADPNGLYGEAEPPALGASNSFGIAIQAQQASDGQSDSSPAYSPPSKVNSRLNANQYADQPFERATIPAADRVTIQRVFER